MNTKNLGVMNILNEFAVLQITIMEQTGYGISLVTKRYGKDAFEFLDFFLRVTIPFEFEIESDDNQDDTENAESRLKTREKTDSVREKTDSTREKIIFLIRENPKITTSMIASNLQISIKGVEWQIKQLKESRIIKRVGPDKGVAKKGLPVFV